MCSLYFFLEFLSLILTDLNQLFPNPNYANLIKFDHISSRTFELTEMKMKNQWNFQPRSTCYIIQKYINWKGEVKTWEKVQHEGWVHIRCLSLSWPRWSPPGSGGCGSRVSAPEPDATESWEHSVNLSELKLLQIKLSIHLNCWCIKLSNWSEASRNQ